MPFETSSLRIRQTWVGRSCLLLLLLAAGSLAFASQVAARESNVIAIAAASDLVFCLEELNAQFRQLHTNAEPQVTVGSSGNFFAQLQRGAPFDLFLSADVRYPEELVRSGKADGSTLTRYATGRLVLWTVRTNLAVTNGLTLLTHPDVRRIALANPEHAPYGRAAKAALESAGLWKGVSDKVVLGDNIAQTAQFVQTGHADVGLVALSLVSAPKLKETGQWWLVPESLHPPLEQGAVLTEYGRQNEGARRYLEFLRSGKARAIFDRYGFRHPVKTN